MEQRTLELTLIGAKDLKQVNLISKMEVYAIVSIAGGYDKTQHRSPTDTINNKNPNWNFPIKFTIDATAAEQNRLTLLIKLRCQRALGDRDVGDVHVPIKELLDGSGGNKQPQFVRYQVRKSSGNPKGELNFSYKFGEKVVIKDEPVTAYPAGHPVSGSGSGYPAPPAQYAATSSTGGYPPPPQGYPVQGQPGYGYPPPQPGYYPPPVYGPPQPGYGHPQQGYPGYPPQQLQKPKKNKAGMGMGMGLAGGLLGGLLIGDMISDAGDFGGCGGGGCGGDF